MHSKHIPSALIIFSIGVLFMTEGALAAMPLSHTIQKSSSSKSSSVSVRKNKSSVSTKKSSSSSKPKPVSKRNGSAASSSSIASETQMKPVQDPIADHTLIQNINVIAGATPVIAQFSLQVTTLETVLTSIEFRFQSFTPYSTLLVYDDSGNFLGKTEKGALDLTSKPIPLPIDKTRNFYVRAVVGSGVNLATGPIIMSSVTPIAKMSSKHPITVTNEKYATIIVTTASASLQNAGNPTGILRPVNAAQIASFNYTVVTNEKTYVPKDVLDFPMLFDVVPSQGVDLQDVAMHMVGRDEKVPCLYAKELIICNPTATFFSSPPKSFTIELLADVSLKGTTGTMRVFAEKLKLTAEQQDMLDLPLGLNPATDPKLKDLFVPGTAWTVQQ